MPDATQKLREERDRALDSARAAMRDTTRITRLLTVLNDPAPISVLLDNILSTVSELFSADIVVLLDAAGSGSFAPTASIGLPEEAANTLCFKFEVAEGPEPDGRLVLREETEPDGELKALGVRTAVWIPLRGSQELRGALALARCRPAPFAKDDIDLLSAMTYRIGLTLEQAQRKERFELIVKYSRDLGRCFDVTRLFEQSVLDLPALTGSDAAAAFRVADDGSLACAAASGESDLLDPAWGWMAAILDADPALLRGETMRLPDILTLAGPTAAPASFAYRSLLAAPIFHDVQLMGVVCALRRNPLGFPQDAGQTLVLYAGQLGTEIESVRLYQALRDELAERRRIEDSLRKNEERFKVLVHNVSDVIAVLAADGIVQYVSDASLKAWGLKPETLVGQALDERLHPDDRAAFRDLIDESRAKPTENLRTVVRLREGVSDAFRYFDAILTNLLQSPAVAGIVSIFHDITASKLHENELSEKACQDPLTKLANRSYLSDRIRLALARAPESAAAVIVIFIDLDDFKKVNDSYGHAAGDAVLRAVAERIHACLRSNDLAARIGGDEFAILVQGAQGVHQLNHLFDRLLSSIGRPIAIDGQEVRVGSSLGIASCGPEEACAESAETLIRKADAAMYAAKRMGKGRYALFEQLDRIGPGEDLPLSK
jgi:diguanylate cyclase (GGDEF)-like protein/PAS domain S-box-containing protein